jgi:hypothetical protein
MRYQEVWIRQAATADTMMAAQLSAMAIAKIAP